MKRRDRQSINRLMSSYERLLGDLQYQLEYRDENERRLAAVEEALKDVQAKVSAPKVSSGLLENIDASAFWLAFLWLETGTYNQLIKVGLPWLYVCFHVGSFFLIARSLVRMYLLFRFKVGWKEIMRFNYSFQLISGISSLVDVWASGKFNYQMSLGSAIVQCTFGSFNLYCGLTNAINTLSERLIHIRQQVQSYLIPTAIFGEVVWPVQNIDSPVYGRPDLMLIVIEDVRREAMQKGPLMVKPLLAFEFWKVKRKLRSLVKKGETASAVVKSSHS